jgi:hypothetical protein
VRRIRRFVSSQRPLLTGLLLTTLFKVDTFHTLLYQPLPWLGITTSKRTDGCDVRWAMMRPCIEDARPQTAVDIGASMGWFSIQLGLRGIHTVALESDPRSIRIMRYAVQKLQLENVYSLGMRVTPQTAGLVPAADAVLFLAVWHHIVKAHGVDAATAVLETIWSRTHRVLFFETGESKVMWDFGLPAFEPDARTWLGDYLSRVCTCGDVVHLGTVPAPQPSREGERNLFVVMRR